MAKDLLSDKAIKAALKQAAETAKPVRLNDGDGLVPLAQPSGVGWWRIRLWRDGVEVKLSAGIYPEVTLTAARRMREGTCQQHGAGLDPSQLRKDEMATRQRQREAKALADAGLPGPGTFEHTAREWLATVHDEKASLGHAERTKLRLEQDAFPWPGRLPIAEIEAPELLACLRRVESRGAIETAHRVRAACGQVFRYGIAIGVCKRDPSADLRDALRPVQTHHHAAIVAPKRVGQLLRDVAAYEGHPVTRAALKLSGLLLRPGELRHLEWAWLDTENALLTVPASLMKRTKDGKRNGAPHFVPLPPQALAVFDELRPLTSGAPHRVYVSPSLLTAERPMSDNTVNTALRRLGYGNTEATAQGFRATARTLIAERLNVAPEVIEAQLAHTVAGPLGRAYDRTSFMDQRRDMMKRWADYLDQLRAGAEVIPSKAA